MRKKVIRLTESDVEKLVKKILTEEKSHVIEEGWKDAVVGGLLTLASLLPKTADAQQDGKVEWDTVKDTVTHISKDNDRDTVRRINTIATKIFKDADGNVDKIVRKIKDETTKPNSWDIKKTKERKIKEFIKIDPITKKEVRLVKKNWEKRNPWREDKILYIDGGSVHPYFSHGYQSPPYKIYRVADPEEFGLEEFKEYVKEYSRLLSLFGEKYSSLDKEKINSILNWKRWKK